MAKMSWAEREERGRARYWGKAALHNLDWALRCEREIATWEAIVVRLRKQLDTVDLLPVDRASTERALAHSLDKIEENRKVALMQNDQVKVNARRAAHAVLVSWGETERM